MTTSTRTFIIILYYWVLFMNLGDSKFIFTNYLLKKNLLIDNFNNFNNFNKLNKLNIELPQNKNEIINNEIINNENVDKNLIKKKSLNAPDDYDVIMMFI